ncbi:hypothetical protein GCM10027265_34720 [Jatrophihabitans fulvus]
MLLGVLTLVLGTSAVVVLWPVAAISWAALYCLDKPVRRAAWPVVLMVMLGAGLVYDIGGWDWNGSGLANLVLFGAPLAVAVLLIAVCGGPARIKERHAQADARRRMLRQAAVAVRRERRKERIREKTGVDVDLLGEVTRDRAGRVTRSLGDRVNRRLERRRPAGSQPAGPPQWLDLDKDVSPDLSKQQRREILDLADQLDETRPRPRPH